MKRDPTDQWGDHDPAVLVLASAWRLKEQADKSNAPATLTRAIRQHLELTRQALAAMVGRDYFKEDIAPRVRQMIEEREENRQ